MKNVIYSQWKLIQIQQESKILISTHEHLELSFALYEIVTVLGR